MPDVPAFLTDEAVALRVTRALTVGLDVSAYVAPADGSAPEVLIGEAPDGEVVVGLCPRDLSDVEVWACRAIFDFVEGAPEVRAAGPLDYGEADVIPALS